MWDKNIKIQQMWDKNLIYGFSPFSDLVYIYKNRYGLKGYVGVELFVKYYHKAIVAEMKLSSQENQPTNEKETPHTTSENRFFDELQAHIVIAGGVKIPIDKLKKYTIESLYKLITPNGIKLKIETAS